jgi:hypothetical protein
VYEKLMIDMMLTNEAAERARESLCIGMKLSAAEHALRRRTRYAGRWRMLKLALERWRRGRN